MKIERIKKNHKKEIIIGGLILVSIVSAITSVTTRAKYRVTQNIKLAKGTVNYKPYDFKIMAMYQQNDSGSYTEINTMPESDYAINAEKSYCTLDNKIHDAEVKLYTNSNGEHVFKNFKKSEKCYLYFDKTKIINSTDLITNNHINIGSPDFSKTAVTDEGIYAVRDGMYGETSYYFRGAVTNNYVMFANKCWRIIRINGDKSIRLIYDGTTCHANGTSGEVAVTNQAYNTNSLNSSYVGWTYAVSNQRPSNNVTATASNAKNQTESWFNTNITGSNLEKVTTGKFCNDRTTALGYVWSAQSSSLYYYAAYARIDMGAPTLNCPAGDTYELKVGAITADEAMYAGGTTTNNTSYYLYNGQSYWTMSPNHWGSGSKGYVFDVHSNGSIDRNSVIATYGIRPVINLRSDITFSSGDGTQNNPYVVS